MLSDANGRFAGDPAAERRSERSVAALLADLANETGLLIRQEAALLKAELSEKLAPTRHQ